MHTGISVLLWMAEGPNEPDNLCWDQVRGWKQCVKVMYTATAAADVGDTVMEVAHQTSPICMHVLLSETKIFRGISLSYKLTGRRD